MRWSEMNRSQKQNLLRLALLALLGAALILAGGRAEQSAIQETESYQQAANRVEQNYCSTSVGGLENQLAQTLSQVKGAGVVTVQIAVHDSGRKEYARDIQRTERNTEETADASQQKTVEIQEQQSVVQQAGQNGALLVQETVPEIRGVLIVADGATQASVKEQLLHAAATLLELSTEKIMVLPGKGAENDETD